MYNKCGLILFAIAFIAMACSLKDDTKQLFNQTIADELAEMYKSDQLAAANAYPPEGYKHLTQQEWQAFKDSIFTSHQKRAKEIFDEYGFVGFSIAGEQGSSNFWLIVQHSDHNPVFQKEVLEKMKIEVENNNADSREYGLLVDRVMLNTGKAQVYGTQVAYDVELCRAYPRNLADSLNVNKRRAEIGLEPLQEYLNNMSRMNFEMNKAFYAKKGLVGPTLYKLE